MKKTILLVLCYILLIFVAQVSKADDSIYRKLIAPENFSESCFYDDGQTNCPKNQECGYKELYNCDYEECRDSGDYFRGGCRDRRILLFILLKSFSIIFAFGLKFSIFLLKESTPVVLLKPIPTIKYPSVLLK